MKRTVKNWTNIFVKPKLTSSHQQLHPSRQHNQEQDFVTRQLSAAPARTSQNDIPMNIAQTTQGPGADDIHEQPRVLDFNSTPAQTPGSAASSSRPKRSRNSVSTYNLAKLSGTDIHGKRAANGDEVDLKRRARRRTIAEESRRNFTVASEGAVTERGSPLVGDEASNGEESAPKPRRRPVGNKTTEARNAMLAPGTFFIKQPNISAAAHSDPAQPLRSESPTSSLRRYSTRRCSTTVDGFVTNLPDAKRTRMPREIRRLQDTAEYAHIETAPVVHTVWSNGKQVPVDPVSGEPLVPSRSEAAKRKAEATAAAAERARREHEAVEAERQQAAQQAAAQEAVVMAMRAKKKKWLEHGLYVGQELKSCESLLGLTGLGVDNVQPIPEILQPWEDNKVLPNPILSGICMLVDGCDYKLPFDVCHPLPPGSAKPDDWKRIAKNRFVGEAARVWKNTPHFTDSSTCVCTPADQCGESCQNRIMLYECNDTNCPIGAEYCTNRAFQDLQERTKLGGKYRIGVEVYQTTDRGFGVRANRCFEPNQIITEYTGEIITEEECDRRMNTIYKHNKCYYLMSFDQNMIIDATTGSIARFVNHSCAPNCRMIKWIVAGQPRMALFAGDNPIMTGDELTYDYNFDPFSAQNVTRCLCGSENCRGVLGPKNAKPGHSSSKTSPAETSKSNSRASSVGSAKVTQSKFGKVLKASKAAAFTNGATAVGQTGCRTAAPTRTAGHKASALKAVAQKVAPSKTSASKATVSKTVAPRAVAKAAGFRAGAGSRRAGHEASLSNKQGPARKAASSIASSSYNNVNTVDADEADTIGDSHVMAASNSANPSNNSAGNKQIRSTKVEHGNTTVAKGAALTKSTATKRKLHNAFESKPDQVEGGPRKKRNTLPSSKKSNDGSRAASSISKTTAVTPSSTLTVSTHVTQEINHGRALLSRRRSRASSQISSLAVSNSNDAPMTQSSITPRLTPITQAPVARKPVTIPSRGGVTLVEGRDFLPANDDDLCPFDIDAF